MAVESSPRVNMYVELFYEKGMKLVDIARTLDVSPEAVRKALLRYDPIAYQREKEARSIERKTDRYSRKLEKKRKSENGKTKLKHVKRNPKYIQEEEEAYAWLQWRHSRIFPFKKKRGASDAEIAWFACAQSGLQNVLKDSHATKDIKSAIRSAQRTFVQMSLIEVYPEFATEYAPGTTKIGKGGGRTGETGKRLLLN